MKILKILFFTFLFLITKITFAVSTPVETVFSDIDKNYKYYNELQDLYDKWAVYPDENGKFNPYKLLTRDEYVSIALEVSCKRCTVPNTPIDLINTFSDKNPYYDVMKNSKYFYCISLADDLSYVRWYDVSYTCADWTYKLWEKPFCPANNITLEEAISVILRTSNIFTIQDNSLVIQDIKNWIITQNLSTDVWPKNTDWSPYTFYGYLRKALSYSIVEYDNNWQQKIYKLLELQDWKVYPKKLVTKEDFLKMAYIALKSNWCKDNLNNNLALNIWVFDKSCNSITEKCDIAKFDKNENIYDFKVEVWWICDKWIDEPNWYLWKFYNNDNWSEIIKYWKYLDNFQFPSNWNWTVYQITTDKCWNSTQVSSTVSIWNNNQKVNLNVVIDADPIEGFVTLSVDFKSNVTWWIAPYTYKWTFWNWDMWNKKDETYIYKEVWQYKVKLVVVDKLWNSWQATTSIKVKKREWDDTEDSWWQDDNWDDDNDWVINIIDICPTVIWVSENSWCPILDTKCSRDCSCPNWYTCDSSDTNVCSVNWICKPVWNINDSLSDCLKSQWLNNIFWNVSCKSCPCDYSLDFYSKIRNCDLLLPAITSPDSTKIYSNWEFYEVR